MNNWQEFKASEHFSLVQNKDIDLKLFDGRVISVYQVVGVSILDNRNETISYKDIGWFSAKKDWSRYNNLQKYHQELNKYDEDTLNDFEWAILNAFEEDSEDYKKVEKLFKNLLEYTEKAQQQIITESKTYL